MQGSLIGMPILQCLFCLTGFAQWKAILHLLLGCEEAPFQTHVHFFVKALRCLLSQLQQSLSQVNMVALWQWQTRHVSTRSAQNMARLFDLESLLMLISAV